MDAQTNVQLLDQLWREGYGKAELTLVRDAYELAKELYAGYFVLSGRPQVAHLVGTASILGALHAPAELVAAGILHNVYGTGDFGDGRAGITKGRRERVRRAVGASVEEYVSRFPGLQAAVHASATSRDPRVLDVARGGLDAMDSIDSGVLLIVVAERLEHRRNFEHVNAYMHRLDQRKEEIAAALGFPTLAAELKAAGDDATGASCAEIARNGRTQSEVLAPRSCRRRLRPVLHAALRRGVHRMGSIARRARGLRRLVGRITR